MDEIVGNIDALQRLHDARPVEHIAGHHFDVRGLGHGANRLRAADQAPHLPSIRHRAEQAPADASGGSGQQNELAGL
jgi:hypothetical protein